MVEKVAGKSTDMAEFFDDGVVKTRGAASTRNGAFHGLL
jgi:hypothetical protein